jgi:hypothetical protein
LPAAASGAGRAEPCEQPDKSAKAHAQYRGVTRLGVTRDPVLEQKKSRSIAEIYWRAGANRSDPVLKIHEFIRPDGELASVFLRQNAGGLELVAEEGALELPAGGLRVVMLRYGAPLDPGAVTELQASLSLADGATLQHVRHLAGYDVIARDYLVYAEPGQAPLCVMATTVAGALRHLALARARPRAT